MSDQTEAQAKLIGALVASQDSTPLKYHWYVIYSDGERVDQPRDDVSKKDPTKSAWFDVDESRIERVGIRNESAYYEVDLAEDTINVNGTILRFPSDEKGTPIRFLRRYNQMTGERWTGYHLGIKYPSIAFSIEVF